MLAPELLQTFRALVWFRYLKKCLNFYTLKIKLCKLCCCVVCIETSTVVFPQAGLIGFPPSAVSSPHSEQPQRFRLASLLGQTESWHKALPIVLCSLTPDSVFGRTVWPSLSLGLSCHLALQRLKKTTTWFNWGWMTVHIPFWVTISQKRRVGVSISLQKAAALPPPL